MNKVAEKNRSITVCCGSSYADNPNFVSVAKDLGRWLALHNYLVLLGGKTIGLSEVVAKAVLANNGHIHCYIPAYWHNEINVDLTDRKMYTICRNLSDRKLLFAQNSDVYLVLPGTYGTLSEFFDIMAQNGAAEVDKQVIIFNINGHFDPLIDFLKSTCNNIKHLHPVNNNFVVVSDLESLSSYLLSSKIEVNYDK